MERDSKVAGEDPASALIYLIQGFRISQAITVAARLGIADLLVDGPRSSQALAEATGTDTQSLYRLLRALASVGVFAEVGGDSFELTPMANLLRTDVPGSLRAASITLGELTYPAWTRLRESVETGRPGFAAVFGAEFFPYLAENPEIASWFQGMMAGLNVRTNAAVPVAYDFSAARKVVDIGGGNGSLLAAILKANPSAQGVLFDLPHVQDDARTNLANAGVLDRCALDSGDFFARVTEGGDIYTLRWILHDWNDADCVRILQSCRKAIVPDGKLLVIEQVVEPGSAPASWITKFLDLQMLVSLGGRERTATEFGELFEASGFHLTRVVPTDAPLSIIEGVPV
jgi:hypothetical protein